MAEERAKIILDVQSRGQKKLTDAKKKLKAVGTSSEKTSGAFKKMEIAALAGAAAIGYLAKQKITESIKLFAQFETGITNVHTLLDKDTFQKFGKQLETETIGILQDYNFSIDDVNKALFDSVSAGVAAGEATDFLKKAAVLAQGGVTQLGVAVDGMTSIINAYGLDQERATDVANAFFTSQKFGKTTVEELSNSIGKVAPIAASAGISFEELLASVSQLTLAGISTDEAITAMKGTITALIKPADEAEKYLRALEIPMGKAAFEGGKLGDTMHKIMTASEGNIDVMAELIPNIRALLATTTMATEKGLKKYDQILNEVRTDTESLDAAFDKQQETLTNLMATYKNKMNVQMIHTGKVLGKGLKMLIKYNEGLDALRDNVLLTFTEMSQAVSNFFGLKWGREDQDAARSQAAIDKLLEDTGVRQELRVIETGNIIANEEARGQKTRDIIAEVDARQKAAAAAEVARKAKLKADEKKAAMAAKIALKQKEKEDKEAKDREIAREDFLASMKQNIWRNLSSSFMALVSLFGEETRALFEISKAAAIADTTIQTWKGATAAIASMAGAGPIGWIAGAGQAAAIIIGGLGNVARIGAQNMEYGGIIPGSQYGTPIVAGEKGKPEAIIPLNQGVQQELGIDSKGETTINVFIENMYADDAEIPDRVAAAFDEAMEMRRSKGSSVFGNSLINQISMA